MSARAAMGRAIVFTRVLSLFSQDTPGDLFPKWGEKGEEELSPMETPHGRYWVLEVKQDVWKHLGLSCKWHLEPNVGTGNVYFSCS